MKTIHHRFMALDSWRGICACIIVLYHFNDFIYNHIGTLPVVEHAYSFVDFFFVLSGFVITASYETKIIKGFPIKDFILLRLARIYPLHLFILSWFVAMELIKGMHDPASAFASEFKSTETLIGSIALFQSMGIYTTNTWNGPSWSISVEFYTYVIWAIALFITKKQIWVGALMMMLMAPFLLWATGYQTINITYDYGFIRSLSGFSAGILCFHLYQKTAQRLEVKSVKFFTGCEIAVLLLLGTVISLFGDSRGMFFSAYLFFACVFVFAFQKGLVSRILLTKPFFFIGALSYSIYLSHAFIQRMFYNVMKKLESSSFIDLKGTLAMEGMPHDIANIHPWYGDLVTILMFAIVIACSYLTYRFIELPPNLWAKNHLRKKRIAL